MSHRVKRGYHERINVADMDLNTVRDIEKVANCSSLFKFTNPKYIEGLKNRSFCFSKLSKYHPEENNTDLINSNGMYDSMEGGLAGEHSALEVEPSSDDPADVKFATVLQKTLENAHNLHFNFNSSEKDTHFKGDSINDLSYEEWGKEVRYRKVLSLSIPDFRLDYCAGSSCYLRLNPEYLDNFERAFGYPCVAIFSSEEL